MKIDLNTMIYFITYFIIDLIMSKRQLYEVIRESIILCRDDSHKFLLIKSISNNYCLPKFYALEKESLKDSIIKGM